MGVILGDNCQIGCSSVTAPGTLIGPTSVAYGLTAIDRGVYEPFTKFANKPIDHGVIEIKKVDSKRI